MLEGERLILKLPTKEDEIKILEMVEEFKDNGEKTIPGSCSIETFENYQDWLERIEKYSNKELLTVGKVPNTQFIAVRKEDNKMIGFVNLRHELNEYLFKFGGHIGASVRHSERRKGYATELINMCFEFYKELGIKNVLITCKDWNIASKASIMKCGGKYENTKTDNDGNNLERYWINLD